MLLAMADMLAGVFLSASPALDLNFRWLYLSSVVGGVLIVTYSVASIHPVGIGLLLLIVFPEITLFLPRQAGAIR